MTLKGPLNEGALEEGAHLWVDGSRGDDDPEVRALDEGGLEEAKQEVGVDAALVSLVDDDAGVLRKGRVLKAVVEQHVVRHVEQTRARPAAALHADLQEIHAFCKQCLSLSSHFTPLFPRSHRSDVFPII